MIQLAIVVTLALPSFLSQFFALGSKWPCILLDTTHFDIALVVVNTGLVFFEAFA